ncbi:MAG: hypothetical protein GYA23_08470 [Methanomicrobiales archaeon]|nr:hypothetical protein [Methanomicrobiales archaeon]
MKPVVNQFRTEVGYFCLVSTMNLVVGAIAIVSGLLYIIASVLGLTNSMASPELRLLTGVVAMICFGLGVSAFHTTRRISAGVREVRDLLDAQDPSLSYERITCLIVRMLAHYREIRRTLGTVILIGPLCGLCLFLLGILTSLETFSCGPGSFSITLDNRITILAQVLTLAILAANLASSYYLTKFAVAWNNRLAEIEESECALKASLGLDEP